MHFVALLIDLRSANEQRILFPYIPRIGNFRSPQLHNFLNENVAFMHIKNWSYFIPFDKLNVFFSLNHFLVQFEKITKDTIQIFFWSKGRLRDVTQNDEHRLMYRFMVCSPTIAWQLKRICIHLHKRANDINTRLAKKSPCVDLFDKRRARILPQSNDWNEYMNKRIDECTLQLRKCI